ncbi:MAG: hypothetical protein GC152_00245 [Alphaproteobacteria bacterium]|nr:hypothetical protein [Alphaproteobacteria bacterium]
MVINFGRRTGVTRRAPGVGIGLAIGSALALALAPGVTLAQNRMAPVSQPTQIMPSFEIGLVSSVVSEMTTDVQPVTFLGRNALRADFGGRIIILVPNACGDGPSAACAGLFSFMFFPAAMGLERLNDYNLEAFIAHASNAPDGSSMFTRYAFCDYGCTRGTVAASVLNYLRAADGYMQALNLGGGTEVSSKVVREPGDPQPTASDVSFELPVDGDATHAIESMAATRLRDWVPADFFSRP